MKNQYLFIWQKSSWNNLLQMFSKSQGVFNLFSKKQNSAGLKFTALIITFMLAGVFVNAQTATPPSAGDGVSTPYQITTLDNLYWLSQNSGEWSKDYIQTADIDASTTSTWHGGDGFSPIGNNSTKFTGEYNGDGHTINGLYIDRTSTNYIGLFGYTNNASVENLGVTNVDISYTYNYTGGLVGYNTNSSTINNSYSTGNVSGSSYTGGLVGQSLNNSTVSNSYSTGTVSCTGNYNGGFVGWNASSSNINNSYSYANISSTGQYTGGLTGVNQANISNSFSTGAVSGSSSVGGFSGYNSASISNSFWDKETTGQSTSAGGLGLFTGQMKLMCTYLNNNWDFIEETANGTEDIWDIDGTTNNGYPFLAWMSTGIIDNGQFTVDNYKLEQNYPNPFNPTTMISFSIPSMQDVKLSIYNSNGQLVKTLLNEKLSRGSHSVLFNAEGLNSRIYFYTLQADGKKLSNKMLLIK